MSSHRDSRLECLDTSLSNTQASMLLVLACYFGITFSVTLFELPSTTAAGELSNTLVNTGIQIMNVLWGVLLGVISLIAWLGQALSAFAPVWAAKLGLTEAEADVDPAFYADARGEALWDTLILWTLPVAGLLLVMNSAMWAIFGLVGGGMYLYFSGRMIIAYRTMQRRGIRIGKPQDVKVKYVFLTLWGLTAAVAIVLAVAALPLA